MKNVAVSGVKSTNEGLWILLVNPELLNQETRSKTAFSMKPSNSRKKLALAQA